VQLALKRNIAIITASQLNRSGYNKKADGASIAGALAKLNELTFLCGVNRHTRDFKNNCVELNLIVSRNTYKTEDLVVCTQNTWMAQPLLDSRWAKDVIWDDVDE